MLDSVRVSSRGSVDVLVVGQFEGAKLDRASAAHDPDGSVKAAVARPEASGALGMMTEAYPSAKDGPGRVLIVGLGEKGKSTAKDMRAVGAAVGRRLATLGAMGSVSVAIELDGATKARGLSAHDAGAAFAESIGLLTWNRGIRKGTGGADAKPKPKLNLRSVDAEFTKGMKHGLGLAESVNITRTLSETPPNIATPDYIASEARAMARKTGLKCTVIKGAKLLEEKLTGIHTVGMASENAPCLVRLEYTPARVKRGAKPVVLVGKTITYDSGGLSIKVGGSMRGMKRDKDGGCAVFGAMHAIATLIKPDVPVVALLSCAENAISDEAYRPDDILEFRNGVTVEVTNTDAEGRLVLADALCWACDKEKPAAIIDMATLTGGVVVALGSTFAGLWCDDDNLRKTLEAAGEATGDRVWRLPHDQQYRDMMKSQPADIVNSAPVREAHPIQGAAFLSYFVTEGTPWAHIDIAGTHATEKDSGAFIPGPTGYGVRLLAEAIAKLTP